MRINISREIIILNWSCKEEVKQCLGHVEAESIKSVTLEELILMIEQRTGQG